jgi:Flp pilus assembly protein TadB
LVPVVFWVGVGGIAWEVVHAWRHRVVITRTEKLYLALAFPLFVFGVLAFDVLGLPTEVALPPAALCLGIALNAWVLKRRIERRVPQD